MAFYRVWRRTGLPGAAGHRGEGLDGLREDGKGEDDAIMMRMMMML